MAYTMTQLTTEINTDPTSLGYATLKVQSNGPEAVAAKLNEIHVSHTLFKALTPTRDLIAEMGAAEYAGWTAAQKTGIDQYLRGEQMKTGSATLRASLAVLIPAGTSRTAMIAACSRPCSRAEFLWGEGTVANINDVATVINP